MAKRGLGQEPEIQAPSLARFKELIETLKRNSKLSFIASGHASTEAKRRECLVSSMWLKDKLFLQDSLSIALHQDVKAHTLFVRFRACDSDLRTHFGLLGAQSLELQSGSEGLVKAMEKILARFCTADDGSVDQGLLRRIKQNAQLLNADGASDEQVSLRLLNSKCSETLWHGRGTERMLVLCFDMNKGTDGNKGMDVNKGKGKTRGLPSVPSSPSSDGESRSRLQLGPIGGLWEATQLSRAEERFTSTDEHLEDEWMPEAMPTPRFTSTDKRLEDEPVLEAMPTPRFTPTDKPLEDEPVPEAMPTPTFTSTDKQLEDESVPEATPTSTSTTKHAS
eukprot:Skav226008  [mRNA]  locus=scaffold1010:155035:158819:- [translate_table: standard]